MYRTVDVRALLVFICAALLLTGCASNNREKTMPTTLDAYAATVRWDSMRNAVGFMHPEERPEPRELAFILDRFEHVRVTSYMASSTGPGPDPDSIVQRVQIRVANKHTAVERTITDRQVWKWFEQDQRWWLMSGLPDITSGR